MNLPRCALALSAAIGFFLAGCKTAPIQHVAVDAITAGGEAAFTGRAYRLLAKDPVLARDAAMFAYASKCVETAMAARGMFEAPPGAPADLVMELDYGVNPLSIPGSVKNNDHYLQLAARRYNPAAAARNFKGEELWDVRVVIQKPDDQLTRLIPILAVAAVNYAGLEKQPDVQVKIREDAPLVSAVMSAAAPIKPKR